MQTTEKGVIMLKGWLGQLLCKHEWSPYQQDKRMKYSCSDSYYRLVEVYVCKKCGKVKKRVIDFK